MSSYADRLQALREQLKAEKLDGFVVPLTDEHMSEYVGSYAQRLAWLTGFEGSAGSAVVLPEEAAIFVDGRYTLQVRQQVSPDRMELPVGARDQHHAMARGACARGRADRLRSLAAHARLGEEGEGSARQPRRRAGAGRAEPDRRDLEGPPRSLEGAPRRPARPICRQVGGREADRDRRLARQAPRRRGGAVGARFDRLGVQHPRRRRHPHAGRAGLCAGPRRRHRRPVRRVGEDRAGGPPASRQRRPAARALRVRRRAVGAQGQDRRRRSRARGRRDLRGAREGRRQDPAAARPDDPSQGDQEPGRDRRPEGRAGRATARRSPASSTGSTRRRPRATSTS